MMGLRSSYAIPQGDLLLRLRRIYSNQLADMIVPLQSDLLHGEEGEMSANSRTLHQTVGLMAQLSHPFAKQRVKALPFGLLEHTG